MLQKAFKGWNLQRFVWIQYICLCTIIVCLLSLCVCCLCMFMILFLVNWLHLSCNTDVYIIGLVLVQQFCMDSFWYCHLGSLFTISERKCHKLKDYYETLNFIYYIIYVRVLHNIIRHALAMCIPEMKPYFKGFCWVISNISRGNIYKP